MKNRMKLLFKFKFRFIAVLLLFLSMRLIAQETLAVGQVLDAVEKTPIANVNVWFKNTAIGIKSNDEGFFMIRNAGSETTLVFSCVGYRTKELKLQQGKSVGVQVELQQTNTELQEVFVLPGTNPALELMKRVRAAKTKNNARGSALYRAETQEQSLVLLAKVNQRAVNQRIFEQLAKGAVDKKENLLTLPLFMSEQNYSLLGKSKTLTTKNIFHSDAQNERIIEQLTGNFTADINFYQPTISLFDKEFISPLADAGTTYYNYYLIDSLQTTAGKEYKLHFRTKNTKNLAFNGSMLVDSGTMALKYIELELPRQANLNFVKNLHLKQQFRLQNASYWLPDSGSVSVNMTYNALADSTKPRPLIFLKNSFRTKTSDYQPPVQNFAGSTFETTDLSEKLRLLNETPIMKTARWLADVLLTGYMQVGKVDVGKIQNIARITDVEGFRLTAPLRTNETLWKNVCLGGYGGYGFANEKWSYSAYGMAKLPFGMRNIVGLSYADDYRRIDYDYNDLLLRENPLVSGDEDIVNTVLAFRSSDKVSRRHELAAWLNTDLNEDVELGIHYRSNRIFSAIALPYVLNNQIFDRIGQQTLTLNARFSFGERVYNDHLQRIYATSYKPVIYTTITGGKYDFGNYSGSYAKLTAAVKQSVKFGIGQWNYAIEGGTIQGRVPYILLETPAGSETDGYKRYQFTCMNYMEYAADNYISMHNELNFNGVVLNNIPLIKHLNLREMISFKMFYGTLSSKHAQILDIPATNYSTNSPYMEVGVGVSNILRLFTLQSVWRLTDLDHPDADRWGLRASVRVSF
jgi:hypothetical protein